MADIWSGDILLPDGKTIKGLHVTASRYVIADKMQKSASRLTMSHLRPRSPRQLYASCLQLIPRKSPYTLLQGLA